MKFLKYNKGNFRYKVVWYKYYYLFVKICLVSTVHLQLFMERVWMDTETFVYFKLKTKYFYNINT